MLTQPSEAVTLPEDVRAAIEQSRNIVTINEAEALRLRELAISHQYTVNELHKQKVELEEQVEKLEKKLAISHGLVAEVETRMEQKSGELRQAEYVLSTVLTATSEKEAENVVKNSALDAREASVSSREAQCDASDIKLGEERALIEASKKLIKDFADSLCQSLPA